MCALGIWAYGDVLGPTTLHLKGGGGGRWPPVGGSFSPPKRFCWPAAGCLCQPPVTALAATFEASLQPPMTQPAAPGKPCKLLHAESRRACHDGTKLMPWKDDPQGVMLNYCTEPPPALPMHTTQRLVQSTQTQGVEPTSV